MIKAFIYTILIFSFSKVYGQDLKKVMLSKDEKKNSVVYKYSYSEKVAYGIIVLLLYANGTFNYSINSFNRNVISFGKWKLEKNLLILNSTISKNNLPIKIDYSSDTTSRTNNCKFNIIKNAEGKEVSDAFVLINNDTTRCLPSYASCIGNYKTIDSIKILIENGITSKWIKLKSDINNLQIDITIEMNLLPSKYYVIENWKYKMNGNRLVRIGL